MADTTPNIGLRKPLESDFVSVDTLNENMERIDQAHGVMHHELISHRAEYENLLLSRTGINANAIINGNFDIWQRGTSFIGGRYTADRWISSVTNPSDNTVTRQSFSSGQTEVPNNPKYFLRLSPTTNQAAGSNMRHRIEGVHTFSGETVTLSTWLRSSIPTTTTIYLRQNFGTGGNPSASVNKLTNVPVTIQWQQFTFTTTLDSVEGKSLGTNGNDCVEVILTTNLGNTAHNFDIAQVQLCVGEKALPFQPRSFGEELALCQRYYEKSYDYGIEIGTRTIHGSAILNAGLTNSLIGNVSYKVRKRIQPTVQIYSTATGALNKVSEYGGQVDVTTADVFAVYFNESNIGAPTSPSRQFHLNVPYSFQWAADAEL
ncbi:hypothetical protein ACF3MZ_29270 [Paenibacillaceae bacterium WGS1546]|uniref:hypothetical protein n=1 Tax=Cohnella sp. WGS1546 TaxID=3366810 RepID=UPI00372D5457